MRNIYVGNDIELRPYTLADAPQLFALIDRNRDHLRQWLTWVDNHTSVHSTEEFIRQSISEEERQTGACLGIFFQNELVGNVSLNSLNMFHRKTNIGYWLSKEAQGRGIMSESVRALITFAFENYNLNRVEILVAVENGKSRAVAERLGFTLEGIRREDCWLYDHFIDQAIYSKLSKD